MQFVDKIAEQTVKVDWRRAAVFAVAAVPYVVGVVAGWIVNGLATVTLWVVAGARAGYADARSRD